MLLMQRSALTAAAILASLISGGCANVWGFDDLTLKRDGGARGDDAASDDGGDGSVIADGDAANTCSYPDSTASACVSFHVDPPACEACLEQYCGCQKSTCVVTQDCCDFTTCRARCAPGDTSCSQSCASAHPTGNSLYAAINDCVCAPSSSCRVVCGCQ